MEKITNIAELESYLSNFYGTEHYYKVAFGGILFTDGVKALAEVAGGGAFWLIDAICSYQGEAPFNKPEIQEFQIWYLPVRADNTAVLTCRTDTHEPVLCSQDIEFTDFPICEDFKIYYINKIILLPGEY